MCVEGVSVGAATFLRAEELPWHVPVLMVLPVPQPPEAGSTRRRVRAVSLIAGSPSFLAITYLWPSHNVPPFSLQRYYWKPTKRLD